MNNLEYENICASLDKLGADFETMEEALLLVESFVTVTV
jgi:hypothetical protein